MKTRISGNSCTECLKAELNRQVEAYNQSIFNDELIEARQHIAMHIVTIEKELISHHTTTAGYNYFTNNLWQ